MGCNECWPWPNWPLLISSALYLLLARRGVWFQRSSWWENEREKEDWCARRQASGGAFVHLCYSIHITNKVVVIVEYRFKRLIFYIMIHIFCFQSLTDIVSQWLCQKKDIIDVFFYNVMYFRVKHLLGKQPLSIISEFVVVVVIYSKVFRYKTSHFGVRIKINVQIYYIRRM